MSNCACVIVDDYDAPEFYFKETRTAKKQHKCAECRRVINPGESYERVKAKWNNYIDTFKTCSDCLNIREEMFCDGYLHGGLYEYLYEHLREEGGVDEDCIASLTPRARAYVCKMIEERWENFDDDDDDDDDENSYD